MLSLLSLILLVPEALARPSVVQIRDSPITVPIAARVNATGTLKLIEADRARAKLLLEKAAQSKDGIGSVVGVPVTNQAVTYTAEVGVGNPPTSYTLIVDTGSSNTWVGAAKPYTRTATSTQTSNNVSVTYGSGSFTGLEFTDQVTLSPGLVISKQSIGVATNTTGVSGVDGILGIGPVDLTVGTLSPANNTPIPTVTDNLFAQGTIASNEISVSFKPTKSSSVTNGELTFGGTDPRKFTGSISYSPITTTFPSSLFWGINQTLSYGSIPILDNSAGIVDTGTTLVLLATDAFSRYQTVTGGVFDSTTGLLSVTPEQFANVQSLLFTVGSTTFELTANAQAWPRKLNTLIGGNSSFVYLIVGDIGTPSGQGLDFINGFTFLERFYSVYDTANQRVGLAKTPFTFATTN